ncbi:hypothetical protein FS749_001824 [Ceratobasidium sp. UAMH 11750]|nr:hypothetical protein FS749_001824 [Ceratobasidium sp. UAMH 11750]
MLWSTPAMRFFSPFAVLGLLHVARGGELDAFAGDRARNARQHLTGRSVPVVGTSNSSAALTSEVPNIFKREQERREQHARVLDDLDANKDDHIEHDEIIRSLAVHWRGEDNARRMLRAFGAPDLEHFMKRSSPEEDGRVPKETLANILEQRPLENPSYCPAIRTKVESCPTHAVLRCGEYLTAAESFCNAGAKNMIEKCIMSESCDNICTCIAAVEDAAHGNGAIEYEGELVQVDNFNSARYPESSLQPRQVVELVEFFALFLWTLIEFLIGVTVLYLVTNLYASLTSANPWMNTVPWDRGNEPEPACSSYVYWGDCGAILSSTARNCPDGGQRVFGNSCKDHFRYGSQGCSVFHAGCKSLCSKVNPRGCPCSLFDWSEFDDQDMPGSDMNKGSFFTSKVSVCRGACEGNSTCKAFVIAPFSGNEEDKRPNCFLKTAQKQTQTVKGSTVFFKRGQNGKCGAPASVPDVPFDDDWFSTSTKTGRRSLGQSQSSALVPRAHKGEVPFPFDRTASVIAEEITWRDNNVLQRPIGNTTATVGFGGSSTGRPADAPYLGREELPEWRPTEIGYRVNGIFRQILHTAVSQNVDDPVARWLNQNVPTTDGGRARWPDSVRQLLLANSRVVHNLDRGYVETWVGQNRPFSGEGDTPPYPGVRAGYDQTMRFYQRGNAGPFSLEAAFIMATQVAGVNFRAVARAYNSNPAGWHV